MIRRIVPVLAAAALIGACSSGTSNAPEPGAPTPSRAEGGRGQERGDGRGRGGAQREEMLLRGITLSADQQRKVDSIRASYRERRQNGERQGGDRSAMREQMEKQMGDIRAVLNSEQQAQFDRNVAEMRDRMQQGGRRPSR